MGWPRCAVKKVSISASEHTLTTSPESTRCCRAPAPIGSRPVCEVPTVSPTVSSLESTSVSQFFPSEPKNPTPPPPTKPSDDPKRSSLVDKRSTDPKNGASPSSKLAPLPSSLKKASSTPTVTTSSTWAPKVLWTPGRPSRCKRRQKFI